jgi:hypothetical protein
MEQRIALLALAAKLADQGSQPRRWDQDDRIEDGAAKIER